MEDEIFVDEIDIKGDEIVDKWSNVTQQLPTMKWAFHWPNLDPFHYVLQLSDVSRWQRFWIKFFFGGQWEKLDA